MTVVLVVVAFAGGELAAASRGACKRSRPRQTASRARPATADSASLTRRESATPGIDRIFQLLPRREMLVERLARTGREISVGQYMLVIDRGHRRRRPWAVLVFARFGVRCRACCSASRSVCSCRISSIGRMGKRRVAAFIGLFPEAIDLMVRALRAGLPITEAIVNAGQEIGDPVGVEFRGIEAGMRLGRDSTRCCGTSPSASTYRSSGFSSSR